MYNQLCQKTSYPTEDKMSYTQVALEVRERESAHNTSDAVISLHRNKAVNSQLETDMYLAGTVEVSHSCH